MGYHPHIIILVGIGWTLTSLFHLNLLRLCLRFCGFHQRIWNCLVLLQVLTAGLGLFVAVGSVAQLGDFIT